MSTYDIDTPAARAVHSATTGSASDLSPKRAAVRNAVSSCQSAAFEGDIPGALAGFWNDHAAPQAQAAESKTRNALAALDVVIECYLAADFSATEFATRAADAIPRDVIQVNDRLK